MHEVEYSGPQSRPKILCEAGEEEFDDGRVSKFTRHDQFENHDRK